MGNRKAISLLATAALLTGAASVGQPQTLDQGSSTTSTASGTDHATTTTDTSVTGSSSPQTSASGSMATGSGDTAASTATDRDQATTTSSTTTRTAGTSTLQGRDAAFLRKAVEGGRAEVQEAQAAMRNAQRAEVRNVASMMLEDHRRANEKLEQLAQRKGWSVPAATDAAEADQSRTSTSAGGDFDSRYMTDEIREHKETIELYRTQAASGSDPDLRQFARDSLPTLEHHLEMLQGSHTQK